MVPLKSIFILTTVCAAMLLVGWNALAGPSSNSVHRPAQASSPSEHQALRAKGQAGLDIALERYDALPPGRERERASALVDRVAAQKYATASRLYWYTDLQAAQAAAKRAGKPILSLRLLGRLDEDFSCANSRMFRTVLYADPMVSAFLRKSFVLHWSSERVVPTMTIDFGNGRVMKSTVGGNSAHYIVDLDGQPLDVLPGLYAPTAFIEALKPGLALAAKIAGSADPAALIKSYHRDAIINSRRKFASRTPALKAALRPYQQPANKKQLIDAEVLTVSKMMIETPSARAISPESAALPDPQAVLAALDAVEKLSGGTRALIAQIGPTDWAASPQGLAGEALDATLATLARRVAADTLINEHGLRPRIHEFFAASELPDFESLNSRIYEDIFVTPASDPWLGMAAPDGFSGLPGDGLATSLASSILNE